MHWIFAHLSPSFLKFQYKHHHAASCKLQLPSNLWSLLKFHKPAVDNNVHYLIIALYFVLVSFLCQWFKNKRCKNAIPFNNASLHPIQICLCSSLFLTTQSYFAQYILPFVINDINFVPLLHASTTVLIRI